MQVLVGDKNIAESFVGRSKNGLESPNYLLPYVTKRVLQKAYVREGVNQEMYVSLANFLKLSFFSFF